VPMLMHGDELGRTQQGNNNVYAQDNELSWVDWNLDAPRLALLEFTQYLVHLRRDHPVLRRRRFFAGRPDEDRESDLRDIAWLTPSGETMGMEAWQVVHARAVMVFLNGEAISEPDLRGEEIVDDSFLIMFNASDEELTFTVPPQNFGAEWTCVLDTGHNLERDATVAAGAKTMVSARSTVVLTRPAGTTSPFPSIKAELAVEVRTVEVPRVEAPAPVEVTTVPPTTKAPAKARSRQRPPIRPSGTTSPADPGTAGPA
ncbi:MAG TPA: glycogen debranching enzyme, partial [Pengzhenrongella sp.]